jgi:AcrR family transcriptional regulator
VTTKSISEPLLLVVAGQEPHERADAARNRKRILEAATMLVAERGIEQVSMDDVARAAGVGTGTLYRRFGDRAGLAHALLDDDTKAFQDELIAGPPPLGPGAPAIERLHAFGDGLLELTERHTHLLLAARPPSAGGGPYELYLTHLTILVREAVPHLDAEYTAQALLSVLGPAQHLRARVGLDWPLERLRAGWHGVVDALAGGGA